VLRPRALEPPTHAGDAVLAALLDGASRVLAPGGDLQFVHHRSLDLAHHLGRFDAVETVARGTDHVVKRATT
jgi:16S rRNA G1207 methylase RsmC